MAKLADINFLRALEEDRETIEEAQQRIAKQNQRASSGSGVGGLGGSILGAILGSLVAPGVGTAVGAGLGNRLGAEAGEQIAGGFEGGDIPETFFFQNDVENQNRLLDMARQDMNTQQWTDALLRGLTTYAAGAAFGGTGTGGSGQTFFTGQQTGSPIAQQTQVPQSSQRLIDEILGGF